MTIHRRELLAGTAGLLSLTAAGAVGAVEVAAAKTRPSGTPFPKGFLWGSATAGHQVEGNNTNSDCWWLENVRPSAFTEPSGDACNSFELWPHDLDLVRSLGLNSYRFSLEWARIEPEPGHYSRAMLDHYARMIDGCHERGLAPLVTFNHFTAPRWFAADGGWMHSEAPARFARFCTVAARHLAAGISHAVTLNEPNLPQLLQVLLPPFVFEAQRANLAAAAKALGVPKFSAANGVNAEDMPAVQAGLLAGHRLGREAIKSVRPDLPVGASLSVVDDQAVGDPANRDARRANVYGVWLEAVKQDDFVGVQNYERSRTGPEGPLPPPEGSPRNWSGAEVYAPSLGNAVRYVHGATGRPIIVTEHGVGTEDDALRAAFIPEALAGLAAAMAEGIPVGGYLHWSLLDNFEWVFGYKPKFGLAAVDRQTFKRTLKPSSSVLAAIARRNAL